MDLKYEPMKTYKIIFWITTGFAINIISALIAHIAMGYNSYSLLVFSIVTVTLSYFSFNKLQQQKTNMMRPGLLLFFPLMLSLSNCQGQTSNSDKMTNEKSNNPLICDPVEGICGIPGSEKDTNISSQATKKPIKIVYFSDPVCSACWGVEPTLRKLKSEYGNSVEIEYHMGGLLPSWEAIGSGVKPSFLAEHSDEMSERFQMPMNGEVWIQDPPQSSYPASIAFKAAQMQDEKKAIEFLRKIREGLYVKSINISKWENIEKIAQSVELDTKKLKQDYENSARKAFDEDLKLAKEMGVRGFPCFFVTNRSGQSEFVYGAKLYSEFEGALLKVHKEVKKESYSREWKNLFTNFNSMTTKEYADLSGISFNEAETFLNELANKKEITKLSTRNGNLWSMEQ